MLCLDFNYADLDVEPTRLLTQRQSISGVQQKTQLKLEHGRLRPVESQGEYILKPAPRMTPAKLPFDIPINEALTMDIAGRLFGIRVAQHELVSFADEELAYLTKRFDRVGDKKLRQEDFCQLANRSPATHGDNYKYDCSYEELAGLMREFCASYIVDSPKVFEIIIFNYVFANGDAHLKNFSLLESPQGDLVLAPAYDLLMTAVHFPNEPTATGLDFFANERFSSRYEELGFFSSSDFIELGAHFGVDEHDVRALLAQYPAKFDSVRTLIDKSLLSQEARGRYLYYVADRLKAISQ